MSAFDQIPVSTAISDASELAQPWQEQASKKPSWAKRILGLLWDSLDNKTPEEHRLVRRLDSCFLYVFSPQLKSVLRYVED